MAGNAKDAKILEYKDLISQLNTTIAAQTELIKSLQQSLEADRAEKKILQEKIDYLTKKPLLFQNISVKAKVRIRNSLKEYLQEMRLSLCQRKNATVPNVVQNFSL